MNYLPYTDMQAHIHSELIRLQQEMLAKLAERQLDEVERLERKIDRLQTELLSLKQNREELD